MLQDFNKPISLLGCGHMGGALLSGWLKRGLAPDLVTIIDPSPKHFTGVRQSASFAELGEPLTGILLLAVKPQQIEAALASTAIASGATLISVAAGVGVDALVRLVPAAQVVRTMPNMGVSVLAGMTGLFAHAGAGEDARSAADKLMGALGKTLWVEDEGALDAFTAVAGSGPAYIFYVTEALAAAAEAEGFSAEVASQLARQTVVGAAELLAASSDTSAADLRRSVTSPGGTTEAALKVLMAPDAISSHMHRAVRAATERAKALAQLTSKT